MEMNTGQKSMPTPPKCDLCEKTMNPTVKVYHDHTRLCKSCYAHMEKMPEILARCVERFLCGNVV